MVLDQPISAHDVGLNVRRPRFDRHIPEFFVYEAGKSENEGINSPFWVNLITQVQRTVIQVNF